MPKALVVEDEVTLRKMYEKRLVRDGFEVVTACNGAEGLQVALTELPDVILLDLLMPVMDGISMVRQLREHPWGKTVPVVVLTALQEVKNAPGFSSLVDKYVVKTTLNIGELGKLLREYVPMRHTGETAPQ